MNDSQRIALRLDMERSVAKSIPPLIDNLTHLMTLPAKPPPRTALTRILADIEASLPKRATVDTQNEPCARYPSFPLTCGMGAKIPTSKDSSDESMPRKKSRTEPFANEKTRTVEDRKDQSQTKRTNSERSAATKALKGLSEICSTFLNLESKIESNIYVELFAAAARFISCELGNSVDANAKELSRRERREYQRTGIKSSSDWLIDFLGELLDNSRAFYRVMDPSFYPNPPIINGYVDAHAWHDSEIENEGRLRKWRETLKANDIVDGSGLNSGRWITGVVREASEDSLLIHFVGHPDREDMRIRRDWSESKQSIFPSCDRVYQTTPANAAPANPAIANGDPAPGTLGVAASSISTQAAAMPPFEHMRIQQGSAWKTEMDDHREPMRHPADIGRICPAGEWRRHLAAGDLVDIMEVDHQWYAGRVVRRLPSTPESTLRSKDARDLQINFVAWERRYDVIVNMYSTRIRRHGTFGAIYESVNRDFVHLNGDPECTFAVPRPAITIPDVPHPESQPLKWSILAPVPANETVSNPTSLRTTSSLMDWFTGHDKWWSATRLRNVRGSSEYNRPLGGDISLLLIDAADQNPFALRSDSKEASASTSAITETTKGSTPSAPIPVSDDVPGTNQGSTFARNLARAFGTAPAQPAQPSATPAPPSATPAPPSAPPSQPTPEPAAQLAPPPLKPEAPLKPRLIPAIGNENALVLDAFIRAGGIASIFKWAHTVTSFEVFCKAVEPICTGSRSLSRPFATEFVPLFLRGACAHSLRLANAPDFSVSRFRRLMELLQLLAREVDPMDGRHRIARNLHSEEDLFTSTSLDRGAGGGYAFPILNRCIILTLLQHVAFSSIGTVHDIGCLILSYYYITPWEDTWSCASCSKENSNAFERCGECTILAPQFFEQRKVRYQALVLMPNVSVYIDYDAFGEYKSDIKDMSISLSTLRVAHSVAHPSDKPEPSTNISADASSAWGYLVSWMREIEPTAGIQQDDFKNFGCEIWECFPPRLLHFMSGVYTTIVHSVDWHPGHSRSLQYLMARANRKPPPAPWSCRQCTFLNPSMSANCEMCDFPK